ncbi:uncharacterized protein H6S33_008853 [Morchella sextelata]|uniref:uncharacterized protein n=1 Tax=Morchella sextelata TaxID=1174677 RepID=UPI001D05514B|nr:uncharacterized protein H6S33_008853 [Morchella sextelata]KAH0612473.1 hypothetical protein H6S33_008853 [Morchella sextelata]
MYAYAVKHLLYTPPEPVPLPPSLPGPSRPPAVVVPSSSRQQPSGSRQEPSSSRQEPSSSRQEPSSSRQQPSSSRQQPSTIIRKRSSSLFNQPSSSKQYPQRELEIDEMSITALANIEVDSSCDKEPAETECDSMEQSWVSRALDILHHTYLVMMDDELTLAPIDPNPRKILDVGTGTGIWAIDMGERYPSAEVIGTDLSPIQPSWVPPNVHFQIDDAESEWTFPKNYFDLIHIRHLSGAIKDWEILYTEAYKHCKPGGWIDIAEYEMDIFSDDGTLPPDCELKKFYTLVSQAADITGREFNSSANLLPVIEKVGFVNAHHTMVRMPLGPWAADKKQKEVGAYLLLSTETGFEAFGIKLFTQVLGMGTEEAGALIGAAQKQANSKKMHVYGKHHLYYAQKPLDAQS